jgi:Fe-Mn family superoxide dismutase
MLYVYGALMPVRVLEEIRFWKMQEREHTVVIRTLVPDLEPPFVRLLEEWEGVFEQAEMAAGRMLEAILRGGIIVAQAQHLQIRELLAAAALQSQQFVQQLMLMEQQSVPVRTRPVVKSVLEHIIRESEYFLGVLQAGDPLLAMPPAPPAPGVPAEALRKADAQEKVYLHAEGVRGELGATGEGTWSDVLSYESPRAAVPIGGHKLPPLPYAYNALEPHIDEATMRLHHDKHHRSYVEGLNRAEKKLAEARETGDFSLVKHWERELAFHGAGHYLHTLFWSVMSPRGGGRPGGALLATIDQSFGSYEKFQKQFSEAANQVEGGGWAILVWSPRSQRLEILTAEKHQNWSQQDIIPLLPLDVWEHAYYLKHRNERAKYVAAWWNVVHWPAVAERFEHAHRLRWTPF